MKERDSYQIVSNVASPRIKGKCMMCANHIDRRSAVSATMFVGMFRRFESSRQGKTAKGFCFDPFDFGNLVSRASRGKKG